jgi:hypothetical protein
MLQLEDVNCSSTIASSSFDMRRQRIFCRSNSLCEGFRNYSCASCIRMCMILRIIAIDSLGTEFFVNLCDE